MKKIIFLGILVTFIPSLLTYLSSSDSFLEWLVNEGIIRNQNINLVGTILGIASVAIPTLVLFIFYEIFKYKAENLKKQRNEILTLLKDAYFYEYEKKMNLNDKTFENLRMRVWKPKTLLFYRRNNKEFVWNPTLFKLLPQHNFDRNNIKNNLQFEVKPASQGLIGECFKTRKMTYSENVKLESEERYNLDPHQQSVTLDTKFVLCYPIFNSKNTKITSIVSFDLEKEVQIPAYKKKYTTETFGYFCTNLSEIVPEIFGKKG